MTDRELLEAAAPAIGRKVTGWNTAQGESVAVLDDGSFWQPMHKNRITDADGDALRLAIRLRISIDFYGNTAEACWFGTAPQEAHSFEEPINDAQGEREATRRAIVRAAAEYQRTHMQGARNDH